MKKLIFLFVFSFTFFMIHAQNKMLGVGTNTPNPNAALHVESPTGNQGFIMPRLTTAQRTAMSAILTANDKGLMLFDTGINAVQVWTGNEWKSPGGDMAGHLVYPFKDSITVPPPAGVPDLFAIKYNSTAARVMRLENLNKGNLSSTLSIRNESSGLGAYIQNTNDTASASVIYATTNSNFVASEGELTPVAVYGESTGTGANAAAFRINNPQNNLTSVYVETNGGGNSIVSRQIGINGSAGHFTTVSFGNYSPAIKANTLGNGPAGLFEIQNASNSSPAILAQTNSPSGNALNVINNSGSGRALSLLGGGMQVSTHYLAASIPSDTVITTRAVAYFISDAAYNDYTFQPGLLNEGDVFYFYKNGEMYSYIEDKEIPPHTGKMFIFLGGFLREF